MAGREPVRYATDVLILGGSGAGVTAAVEVRRAGLGCVLVNKGRLGKSGNALMAGGGFGISGEAAKKRLGLENADESVTQDRWFADIVKEGYFLGEQDLIEQFVEEGPDAVGQFIAWSREAGEPFRFSPPGKWNAAGRSWPGTLKYAADAYADARVLNDVMAVELLKSEKDGRVAGALCLDVNSGDLLVVEAGAVVVATGGYQPFSFKNTVSDMTGDGMAMALRAGAKLADMEFLLFFPTALSPRSIRGSIYPYVVQTFWGRGADLWPRYRDGRGEVIDIPDDVLKATGFRKGSKLSKLVTTYYWGRRIREGRGTPDGGVYADYGGYPPEKYDEAFEKFSKGIGSFYPRGCFQGNDLSGVLAAVRAGEMLEWAPGCEYSNGGICVNTEMETGVAGLLAAGEAASGVFGACRVGDGLVEMLVQGRVAGRNAAKFVKSEKVPPRCSADILGGCIHRIEAPLNAVSGVPPRQLYAEIEKICDSGFGYIRDEPGMAAALSRLSDLPDPLEGTKCSASSRRYNYEWIRAIEAGNLLLCAKAGVLSAVGRRESRGCHIREDRPEVDHERGLYRSVVSLEESGGLKLTEKRPKMHRIPPPEGRDRDVMEYFLRPDLKYGIGGGA